MKRLSIDPQIKSGYRDEEYEYPTQQFLTQIN